LIVRFEARFAKDLRDMRDKTLLTRISEILDNVKQAEGIADIRGLKKLKGSENYYRIRIGDYRLGLELNGTEFVFVRCLHRKEIYRYFP
jgi:mRNA interferase RelE/StbE